MVQRSDTAVTLTGPGGTGKTSLALQTASDLVDAFAGGAYVVMLQAIREPELMLPTIALTLGVSEAAGQSLSAYLAPKELLLVLDNFEQIIGGAPTLADLLAQAPHVRLIVTSREPLHIAGEQVFPVPRWRPTPGIRDPPRLPTALQCAFRRSRTIRGAWLRAHRAEWPRSRVVRASTDCRSRSSLLRRAFRPVARSDAEAPGRAPKS
jgi:predicted ATPase